MLQAQVLITLSMPNNDWVDMRVVTGTEPNTQRASGRYVTGALAQSEELTAQVGIGWFAMS
jgi:hypothetical protein